MPFVQAGDKAKEWLFDVAEVLKWREQQAIEAATGNTKDAEYEEARRRKIAAEAGILEIELQQRRAEVIPRDEVAQALTQAYITIKQRLRTIPDRVVPQLIAETDERLCNELLLQEIDDALLDLSQLNYCDTTAQSSEEAPSTTA